MAFVKLDQGFYRGVTKDEVHCFYGIPYAKPFERFQHAEPIEHGDGEFDVSCMASLPPQRPSRLESVTGPFPPGTGSQDERTCGVLSVFAPTTQAEQLRPVIAWIHGGAFVSGGSQIPLYDGRHLARDGNVVVVCLSYRLGVFGFLYQEHQSLPDQLPLGTADVVRGLEWVRSNIVAFGGDAENVTVFGQSAGAYQIQTLFDTRPDLFNRAILQSSPAAEYTSVSDGQGIRASVCHALGGEAFLGTASTSQLLEAESKVVQAYSHLWLTFCPVSRGSTSPGCRTSASVSNAKDVLIGWTKDDGLCFARMQQPDAEVSELDQSLTQKLFRGPSEDLASRMQLLGHRVATYELTWAPQGFDLGATHCIDLPLCFGDEVAWKSSPMMGSTPWTEWTVRGIRHRRAWAEFARSGTVPASHDGLQMLGVP